MKKIIFLIFTFALVLGVIFTFRPTAQASTLDDLKKEQAALDKKIQANRGAITSTQIQANDIQGTINGLSGQISAMQKDIDLSNQKIDLTNKEINATLADINAQTQELKKQKENLYETVRAFYENPTPSTLEVILTSNSLSDVLDRSQYLDSISGKLDQQIKSINQIMANLDARKNDLQNQKASLQSQKNAIVAQQSDLDGQQQVKAGLLSNAKATISDLQTQQAVAQARIDEINRQMAVLTGTSNWGSQIISEDSGGWYYSQIGNYTHLGKSPYTVDTYGCLITSIAMVDTYYGNKTTPTDIANMWWLFDKGGYLRSTSIPGVSVGSSQSIDWNVVNSEVAQKHPVIVSVYLPSVGAINTDGSSHFIVIKGLSGGKYLMQDPIGPGRSYNLNQIRSMKIVTP